MTPSGRRLPAKDTVAVVVATYNSSLFVLETLESVRKQSYPNLELIISDDASRDDTMPLVREWIEKEVTKTRFERIEILEVDTNTGISANCNRAIKKVKSRWVKLIAGDDILLPDCILDNMNFCLEHQDARVVFSKVRIYANTFEAGNYLNSKPSVLPFYCIDPTISASDQYKLLLVGDRINFSPSVFIQTEVIGQVGGYDESNRLFEDYPMWLKVTRAGNRLHFMNAETVGYRRHANAIVNTNAEVLFKPIFFKVSAFRRKNVLWQLPWDLAWNERQVVGISWVFQKLGWNKDTALFRGLYRLWTVYLNPFRYVIYFKRKVLGLGRTDIFYKYA